MVILKLLTAAAIAYVGTRAGWIFLGWLGAIVVVALLVAASAAARRGKREISFGLAAGAAVSVVALLL